MQIHHCQLYKLYFMQVEKKPYYEVINCISGPRYPSNSKDLAELTRGFTEYCVLADPGPTPGLCVEIFLSKGREIYFPGMSTYAGTVIKGTQGYGAGTYPGIYKKNVLRSPGQYPGLYLGHHKVQN